MVKCPISRSEVLQDVLSNPSSVAKQTAGRHLNSIRSYQRTSTLPFGVLQP
jgi:hypothetical protein